MAAKHLISQYWPSPLPPLSLPRPLSRRPLHRYFLWQVVPINNYKKTDDAHHLPTSVAGLAGLRGPVSTYGVVLTSVADMQ